jgi:hypothetical protein
MTENTEEEKVVIEQAALAFNLHKDVPTAEYRVVLAQREAGMQPQPHSAWPGFDSNRRWPG